MKIWYHVIRQDATQLPACLDYYQQQYVQAKAALPLRGALDRASAGIAHELEHVFAQLQDLEAILEHINIRYTAARAACFRSWFENQHAARSLSARECEKYVDGDADVNAMADLVNECALVRNLFLSIIKGMDAKAWQITNLVKLKQAGLDHVQV